jgi:NSS family neurotransmitter:Na+ symporter
MAKEDTTTVDSGGESAQQWGTKVGVILAVAGSAVGLGNFLRFPGMAAQNGGGAFMLPYFVALLLLGIPIGWAEWTMGRWGGKRGFHSAPFILGALSGRRLFRYIGVLGVLIPLTVSFYYTYIEAWCLSYAIKYATGGMSAIANAGEIPAQTAAAAQMFAATVGAESNGVMAGGTSHTLIIWALVFSLNIYLVYKGISGGIEKFCQLAMPTMAVCALIVLARVLTLGTPDPNFPEQNVLNGLGFMWNPDFAALANGQTWLAAAGQIFFSLSVGFGVIINYASYMKKDSDVVLSGLTASATNEVFEVSFGGMITLTSAFVFLGASTATAAKAGTFGLGFTTLPVVFAQMGGAGALVGAVWFFMLFLAAITSSISMYQPAMAFFDESLGRGRNVSTALVVLCCLAGSFCTMFFSKDLIFLDTLDSWLGTFGIYILAMVQLAIFSFMFGISRGLDEAHQGAHIRIPAVFRPVLAFIAPLYLLIVFGAFAYGSLPTWIADVAAEPVRQYALGLVFAITLLLFACVHIGEKRLAEDNIPIDGIDEPGPSGDTGPAGPEEE